MNAEYFCGNVLEVKFNSGLIRGLITLLILGFKHSLGSHYKEIVVGNPTKPPIEANDSVVYESRLTRLRLHIKEKRFQYRMRER